MMLESGTISFRASSCSFGIAEIHQMRRERSIVLVQRDQRLPAERGQRVEMQLERYGNSWDT